MAALTMFAASCTSELDAPDAGRVLADGEAVFTVQLPATMGSRAAAPQNLSDGTTATELKVYVYDHESEKFVFETETLLMQDLHKEVTLQLATGKVYDIVFWAQSPEAPYVYDKDKREMHMNYFGTNGKNLSPFEFQKAELESALANDEHRDAFFKVINGLKSVKGGSTETIYLKRPFAQLNLGTTQADLDAANRAHNGVEITKTDLTVKTYTTLQLGTKESAAAKATGQQVEVHYALNDFVQTTKPYAFPYVAKGDGEVYQWISMNYILCGDEESDNNKYLTDVKVSHYAGTDAAGIAACKELEYYNIPLQRNFRTNIFGQLLTKTTAVRVVIDPMYNAPDYGVINWNNVPDLQKDATTGKLFVRIDNNSVEDNDGDYHNETPEHAIDNYLAFVQAFNEGYYTTDMVIPDGGRLPNLDLQSRAGGDAVTDMEVRFACTWNIAKVELGEAFTGTFIGNDGKEMPRLHTSIDFDTHVATNYLEVADIEKVASMQEAAKSENFGVNADIKLWAVDGFKYSKVLDPAADIYYKGTLLAKVETCGAGIGVHFDAKDADVDAKFSNFVVALKAGLYPADINICALNGYEISEEALAGCTYGQLLKNHAGDAPQPTNITIVGTNGEREVTGFDCSQMGLDSINTLIGQIKAAYLSQNPNYYDASKKRNKKIYLIFPEETDFSQISPRPTKDVLAYMWNSTKQRHDQVNNSKWSTGESPSRASVGDFTERFSEMDDLLDYP